MNGVKSRRYAGSRRAIQAAGRRRWTGEGPRTVLAFLAIAALGLAAVFVGMRATSVPTVRICSTSMTDRLVGEILGAYPPGAGRDARTRYVVGRAGDAPCDVRFGANLEGPSQWVIAHDGVVAVVNAHDSLARIRLDQLRDVLSGKISNWAQLGGPPGPISVVVPQDASDEAQLVAARVMHGNPIGAQAVRVATTADVVQRIADAGSERAIGIAALSASVPAKVVPLDGAPLPTPAAVADGAYPLSVRLMAGSDYRHPSLAAAALIDFAHSQAVQSLVVRSALEEK